MESCTAWFLVFLDKYQEASFIPVSWWSLDRLANRSLNLEPISVLATLTGWYYCLSHIYVLCVWTRPCFKSKRGVINIFSSGENAVCVGKYMTCQSLCFESWRATPSFPLHPTSLTLANFLKNSSKKPGKPQTHIDTAHHGHHSVSLRTFRGLQYKPAFAVCKVCHCWQVNCLN